MDYTRDKIAIAIPIYTIIYCHTSTDSFVLAYYVTHVLGDDL
jgi:hypothetical protein